MLVGAALWKVFGYTIRNIQAYTYPDITMPQLNIPLSTVSDVKSLPPLTVDQLTRSWGSRNLLGAMSLQFYWLMTSASELSRCKYCGRVISYVYWYRPRRALRAANPVRIRRSVTASVGITTIITIASSPDAEASVVDRGMTVTGFNIRKHRETLGLEMELT